LRVFDLLTPISDVGCTASGDRLWSCSCQCGGVVVVPWGDLESGQRTSCGCVGERAVAATSPAVKTLTINGQTKTIQAWADEMDLNYQVLYKRLIRGQDPLIALTTPIRKRSKKGTP